MKLRQIVPIDKKKVRLNIYGVIGSENYYNENTNNTASSVRAALDYCEAYFDDIELHINSIGGYVSEGNAICEAIKNSKKNITAYCDGIAASMGALIFMSASQRVSAEHAVFIFHAPSTITMGNRADHLEAIENLDAFTEGFTTLISNITNQTKEEIINKFFNEKDNSFSAEKMKDLGLIHSFSGQEAIFPNGVKDKVLNFKKNSADITTAYLNTYQVVAWCDDEELKNNNSNQQETFTEMKKENLIKILDMASDSTDEQIEDKVKDLVKNQIQQTSNNEEKPPITNSVGMTDEERQKIIDGVAAILGKSAEKLEVQDTTAPPKENVLDMKSPMSYKEQLEAEYAKEEN